MTLSRNYDAAQAYILHRDHAMFNEGQNAFSDFCLNSPCGSFANDKIKFLTLPDKGFLFYNANPTGVANYQPVTIGQEMLVKDLIDYKILKFNGEGSFDNQYAINYLTNFKIERFCSGVSTNIITTVSLNMILKTVVMSELELFSRSIGVNPDMSPTVCSLPTNGAMVYVNRWGRPGMDLQTGDRVYSNNTGSIFNGQSKMYNLLNALSPNPTPSYGCVIDSNGFVMVYHICN